MSKCKRNILLIFGFLLIVNLLFIPCNKIDYGLFEVIPLTHAEILDSEHPGRSQEIKIKIIRRASSKYVKVFFPLVISRASKHKEYLKWESATLLMLERKIEAKEELITQYSELDRQYIKKYKKNRLLSSYEVFGMDDEILKKLKKKKELSQFTKLTMKIYEIEKEIKEICREKNKEFHEKFGYKPHYYQIRVEGIFIELAILIFIGGFTTIFFCIVIRKIRGTMREAWRDAIKRRKIGVVLILTGIGVPMVLAPFIWRRTQISRWGVDFLGIEFLFKYPLMIGIILFLIGAGMVIFSFFPKDVNPKK